MGSYNIYVQFCSIPVHAVVEGNEKTYVTAERVLK